jgi:hypothetical protein
MMQKDERFLLKPWLAYYGYLFGYQNLYVLDNGSELAETRAILSEYAAKGVVVDSTPIGRSAYESKGDIVGGLMRRLDLQGRYDFIIPLDCDEFIALKQDSRYTFSRDRILAYLSTLVGESRVLRFPYQLANHPLQPDIYHYYSMFKVFFAANTFDHIDHGNHFGKSSRSNGFRDTDLVQVHFHFKRYDVLREQARRSWVGTVDIDDSAALEDYTGPSLHLKQYFLKDREAYYRDFLEKPYFFLPELSTLLKSLGSPIDLPDDAIPEHLRIRIAEMAANTGAQGQAVLVPGYNSSGNEFVLETFNGSLYLEVHPDVAKANVDPVLHFCLHGVQERRRLR